MEPNLKNDEKTLFEEITPEAGKEISSAEADEYLKKYSSIRDAIRSEILSLIQAKSIPIDQKKELMSYYSSNRNAFIFSRRLIERFFKETDENGNAQKPAEYLMIVSGAKYKVDPNDDPNVEIGNPTIVVLGVTKKNSEYNSQNPATAGDEQPDDPGNIVTVPKPDSDGLTRTKFAVTL